MGQTAKLLFGYVDDDRAATAIEYALIAGAISIAIVTVVTQIGVNLSLVFNQVSSGF